MKTVRSVALLGLVAAVAACASPKKNTLTVEDFSTAETKLTEAKAAAVAPEAISRKDSADFKGSATAKFDEGQILGDVAMNVNFGSGEVTGKVDNVNLLNSTIERSGAKIASQALGGDLTVAGKVNGNKLESTATGTLKVVATKSGFGLTRDMKMDGTLNGDFRSAKKEADTITGALGGTITVEGSTKTLTEEKGGFYASEVTK